MEREPQGAREGRSLARRATRAAAWALIIAAIVNVPLSVEFLLPAKWTRKPGVTLSGTNAAARGWPAPTPHEKAWPDPSMTTIERAFARRRTETWTVQALDRGLPPRTTHKIVDMRYGWPLKCLRRTQLWWPDNQEWRIDAEWDTGVRLDWTGVLLNPVIAAAGAWAIVFGPWGVWRAVVGWRRRRAGCCPRCGYPIGTSPVCTECGAPVRDSPYDPGAC